LQRWLRLFIAAAALIAFAAQLAPRDGLLLGLAKMF